MRRPRVKYRRRFVPFALAAAGACASGGAEESDRRASPALVPVIGLWTSIGDGDPALQVDGARWNGLTPRDSVAARLTTLFGAPAEAFLAQATSEGAFPIALWSDTTSFSSGTLRVRFRLDGGESDQNAGIVLGLRPSGEYVFVRYNTKDGDVAVWEYVNGTRRVLVHGTTHEQLPLGEWHELVVTVDGATVRGEVTGRSVSVEHTFEAPLVGRVGLWTKRDAVTTFRDFRVERAN
ncbi:MAG TPA: hypothetical protein VF178_00790 [Gemmatimonadaceae bacterium]